MNWVKFRLWAYVPIMLGALAAGIIIAINFDGDPLIVLAIAVALFVPGRISRFLLRDLIQSRRQLAQGDFEAALNSAQSFLDDCYRRPWIRHAMWGLYGIYSLDVICMGLNNAGAALVDLGRLDEGEGFLKASMEKDPHYPLPVMNLGRLELRRGNRARADTLAARANDLGFPMRDLDEIERVIARKRSANRR